MKKKIEAVTFFLKPSRLILRKDLRYKPVKHRGKASEKMVIEWKS